MLAAALMLALCTAAAPPRVTVSALPLTEPMPPVDVPWEQREPVWQDRAPIVQLRDAAAPGLEATLRAAMDATQLMLHVVVRDAIHVNHQQGANIWDGDAIQLSIDGRGDGAPGLLARSDFCGEDDASLTVALTDSGPQGWVHVRGLPDVGGALSPPPRIQRDAPSRTTTYDIAIPWSALHTVAGAAPRIGLALQLNDTDGHGVTHRLRWGGGPAGTLQPGLLQALTLGAPPADYVAIEDSRHEVASDRGEAAMAQATLVLHTAAPMRLRMAFGTTRREIALPARPTLQRLAIRVRPPMSGGAPTPVDITIVDAQGRVRAGVVLQVHDVRGALAALQTTVARLLATAPPPLIARHLRTLVAIVEQAWSAAALHFVDNPQLARQVSASAQAVNASLTPGLTTPGPLWDDYLTGRRRLVLAFISPVDQTLQPYLVRLPTDFQAKPAGRAALLFLHGKGDPDLLHFVVSAQAARSADAAADAAVDAVVIAPWGRGNMGYVGVGETDVLDALEAASALLHLDPDRVALMGFSMGGAGAWSLALHRPDLWSAVAIHAGGTWLTSLGVGLGENARGLPLSIWHGDADGAVAVAEAYKMRDELLAHQITPLFTIAPGVGHVFAPATEARAIAWALAQSRQRPREFSYVADDFAHRGRNGVWLRRDTERQPFPRFQCRVTDHDVSIDSVGTVGLDVALGAEGLGFTEGEVRVIWNGKQVYQGAPRLLELGEGAGRR